MRRPFAALGAAFVLALSGLSVGAQESTVTFKVFPSSYELWWQGRLVRPVERTESWRRYALPPGPQTLTFTAEGHQPLTRRLSLSPRVQVEERLLPLGGPLTLEAEGRTGPQPRSLLFSPEGDRIFVPLLNGSGVEVWNRSPLERRTVLVPPGFEGQRGLVEAAYSPLTRELWISPVTGSRLFLYDMDTLAYKGEISTEGLFVKVMAFSPDGRQVALTNWESPRILLLDPQTRTVTARLDTSGIPRGLGWSPDGRRLYAALFDVGRLDRFTDGRPDGRLELGEDTAPRHVLVRDGRIYISEMARGQLIWADEASFRVVGRLNLAPNINAMAESPDGAWVAVLTRGRNNPEDFTRPGPDFGRLFLLHRPSGRLAPVYWGRNQPTGLAWSPDGRWLAFTDFLDDNLQLYRRER